MLRWAPFPFVRITLSFIAGILLYLISGKEFSYSTELLAFFVGVYLILFILSRKRKTASITSITGIVGILCFVAGGVWVTHLKTESHRADHLLHLKTSPAYYMGVVDSYVLQKPGYQTTVLQLEQVQVNRQWQPVRGKVQLSVPHDSGREYELRYGDRILVKGAPQKVEAALNPQQFNYAAYLAGKNIYHRQFLQSEQYLTIGSDPGNPILYYSILMRRYLDKQVRQNVPEQREYGISTALLLGVTDELDNSIKAAYTNSGTIHVLSVSGLHVGLIYGVLMLFLGKFNRTPRQRFYTALIAIALLWLYAFITGLSPSVLRSVVMFTMVTLALAIGRRSNIYNTLAIAAFVLLLHNPYFVLDVGFQLSFLAVLGIVYLQPKLYTLVEVNNRVSKFFWALFTVSLAAQLATSPLSLYYFHQFPVYFWLANLVVVPLSTVALYSGLAAIGFGWIPVIGWLLYQLHFWVIWCMNEINFYLISLPNALLDGISITAFQTWLLYALFFMLILFFALKKLPYLAIAASILFVLAVQQILETIAQRKQQFFSIYSLRGQTALSFIQGQQAVLLADSITLTDKQDYTFNIQPHLWHLGIRKPKPQFLHTFTQLQSINHALLPDSNSLYAWQNKTLLLLHRPLKVQAISPLPVDYLILANNVRINPEELQQFRYKHLILDSSNSLWYREKTKQQLDTLGLVYYDVADKGAFVD